MAEAVYWSLKELLSKHATIEQTTPATTQQAFTSDTLAARDPRFIGREDAVGVMATALNDWRNGHASMVSIQGPQGAGISSLLAQVATLTQPDELLIS